MSGQLEDGSAIPEEAQEVSLRRPPGIEALTSGAYLDPEAAARAERCLVVALEHAAGEVDELADRLASLQAVSGDFKPIVVVRSSSTRRLRFHGFLYERVMPPSQWERVATRDAYPQYASQRLDRIRDMYEPHVRVDLPGGAELTAEVLERARARARAGQGPAAGAER